MEAVIVIGITVYALIFGTLSRLAVKGKNRDRDGWFIIGLFLGVFGFIAALLVDELEIPGKPAEKKCPDCAELVKKDARICRYCKYEFKEGVTS